jgi:hypothetical protein
VQSIHLVPFALLLVCPDIPLLLQLLQVVMNILFELSHALCRKGMRDCLPLARMFRPIPRIEQTSSNTHKRVIVFALEEAVTVPIYLRDSIGVGNTDVVRLNAHELPVFGMCVMNGKETFAATALSEKPEICEGSREGRGDGTYLPVSDIRQKIV